MSAKSSRTSAAFNIGRVFLVGEHSWTVKKKRECTLSLASFQRFYNWITNINKVAHNHPHRMTTIKVSSSIINYLQKVRMSSMNGTNTNIWLHDTNNIIRCRFAERPMCDLFFMFVRQSSIDGTQLASARQTMTIDPELFCVKPNDLDHPTPNNNRTGLCSFNDIKQNANHAQASIIWAISREKMDWYYYVVEHKHKETPFSILELFWRWFFSDTMPST